VTCDFEPNSGPALAKRRNGEILANDATLSDQNMAIQDLIEGKIVRLLYKRLNDYQD